MMPYDDPDPTDPMTLHRVVVETGDAEALREMAVCIVEEYIRLGLSADRIHDLFTDGRFAGPSLALTHLGPDVVRQIIDEQFAMRKARAPRVAVTRTARGAIALPVLQTEE